MVSPLNDIYRILGKYVRRMTPSESFYKGFLKKSQRDGRAGTASTRIKGGERGDRAEKGEWKDGKEENRQ